MEKRFCPRCNSENVRMNITATAALGAPQSWICDDCGYSNIVFPVKEAEEGKSKKNKKTK
jgi:transposase-like protein